jgi:hypothetical protein
MARQWMGLGCATPKRRVMAANLSMPHLASPIMREMESERATINQPSLTQPQFLLPPDMFSGGIWEFIRRLVGKMEERYHHTT